MYFETIRRPSSVMKCHHNRNRACDASEKDQIQNGLEWDFVLIALFRSKRGRSGASFEAALAQMAAS